MQSSLPAPLISKWQLLPSDVRSAPASEGQLLAFESFHGPIPVEYRDFLSICGGGPVGAEWIDGIEELTDTHRKFHRERGPAGWENADVFVIGWDGAGNPISIDGAGKVVVEDHNFGGVRVLAPSFSAFLAKGLGYAL